MVKFRTNTFIFISLFAVISLAISLPPGPNTPQNVDTDRVNLGDSIVAMRNLVLDNASLNQGFKEIINTLYAAAGLSTPTLHQGNQSSAPNSTASQTLLGILFSFCLLFFPFCLKTQFMTITRLFSTCFAPPIPPPRPFLF